MILIMIVSLLLAGAQETAEIKIRFLGNEGFELTDGITTLLSDFPYESGAFGYMTYETELLETRKNAYCLITHQHKDHFDAALQSKVGCKVVGPEDVLQKVPTEFRAKWEKHQAHVNDINITAIPSPHAKVDHYSYRVDWKNKSFYFVGDTEEPAALLKQSKLDVLFITPWLLEKIPEQKLKTLADKVVVYHHTAADKIDCSFCIVPKQGELIR